VTLYYQGRYVDGKVFDNQHVQKDPITVPVSDMIPGWQEAVTHMVPGSIWVLYIPGNLAYGERGLPGKVGPNQTLIYTINLLAVSPPH
jgi:FKBP-type peptidyl-prolyl cis-trans isomerase